MPKLYQHTHNSNSDGQDKHQRLKSLNEISELSSLPLKPSIVKKRGRLDLVLLLVLSRRRRMRRMIPIEGRNGRSRTERRTRKRPSGGKFWRKRGS